jgi:hypothetical protein
MRDYQIKLQTGEYIGTWHGYSPFHLGCFYGDGLVLGGEEKFKHCAGFFSGVVSIDYWIKEEIDKLTQEEQDELLFILKRNKDFYEHKHRLATPLAKALNVEPYQIHRLSSKELQAFLQLVDSKSN